MADADDIDVEFGQPAGGCVDGGAVEVEHTRHGDTTHIGERVAGEQHTVLRQMERQTALGVAGNCQNLCAAAEIEHFAAA